MLGPKDYSSDKIAFSADVTPAYDRSLECLLSTERFFKRKTGFIGFGFSFSSFDLEFFYF